MTTFLRPLRFRKWAIIRKTVKSKYLMASERSEHITSPTNTAGIKLAANFITDVNCF